MKCPVCGVGEVKTGAKTCSRKCGYEFRRRQQVRNGDVAPRPEAGAPHEANTEIVRRCLTKARKQLTIREISERIDKSEATVRKALEALGEEGHNVLIRSDGAAELVREVSPGNTEPLIIHNPQRFMNKFRVFGACGDNHLGSKHERLDVLNALYDLYEHEGVTDVFNTGNWIEGESRFNTHDIKVFGLDDQINYFIEHYPQRKGVTTHFVAGDDHEGWYQKKERLEIGRYAALRAKEDGRDDLKYLGYLEADVHLKAQDGYRWMKVMHPGGGSAYAISYAMQKIVESFQGGEKPAVLLCGHYHKFDYCYPREVHCVQTGCTVDQSIFMRKCKIQAHVGGCLIRINQAPDGMINRFQVEWVPFYDRGFYEPKRRNF